ncbi:hypothetical protein ACE6H2_018002 [Prunus campanulata]
MCSSIVTPDEALVAGTRKLKWKEKIKKSPLPFPLLRDGKSWRLFLLAFIKLRQESSQKLSIQFKLC